MALPSVLFKERQDELFQKRLRFSATIRTEAKPFKGSRQVDGNSDSPRAMQVPSTPLENV